MAEFSVTTIPVSLVDVQGSPCTLTAAIGPEEVHLRLDGERVGTAGRTTFTEWVLHPSEDYGVGHCSFSFTPDARIAVTITPRTSLAVEDAMIPEDTVFELRTALSGAEPPA